MIFHFESSRIARYITLLPIYNWNETFHGIFSIWFQFFSMIYSKERSDKKVESIQSKHSLPEHFRVNPLNFDDRKFVFFESHSFKRIY